MSSARPSTRCWYHRDDVVDEYKSTLTDDGEPLPMLKTLKIIRAIIVNVGIFGVGAYAMYLEADPTLLAISTLAVAGAYNGLEIGDYLALVQAYQEVQEESLDRED